MTIKTPREYRKKVAKEVEVELPSGLVCTIRGMPPLKLLQLTAEAQVEGVKLEDYMKKNMVEVLLTVIPSSVVSPEILPPREGGPIISEDALHLDELSIPDLVTLLNEIVAVSGLDEEKLKSFRKFPDERHRKGDSPNSQGVQL